MVKQKILKILNKIENPVDYDYSELEKYTFFKLKQRKFYYLIQPVKKFNPLKFEDLLFLENHKKVIYENTKKFLQKGKANNILLWGERGCGKSTLIKSVISKINDKNLKLVLIKKNELNILEEIIDNFLSLPMKFIIFLDDLSFKEIDDNFISLKTVFDTIENIENPNMILYATSNRRHLIEEKFLSDEIIHENDTISEIISLSDRFGLSLGFYKLDKKQYLEIARYYAQKEKVINKFSEKDALYFAMKKGGFTGRIAYQYILTL